ncbi:MAG TPA: enoyl-CoA hydratase-related protein [Candidatus Dormibacteraeota bacterium]|nr:enoyl-CoA hydratase-related protein [Candidatus Dormibacteraeota bacterium]
MIELSRRGDCALLTLNRPQVLNALTFAMLDELEGHLEEVVHMGVRAVIVTGAGDRAFCAGADIDEYRSRPPIENKRRMQRGQALFQRLEELPLLSVAAINGYALGGGLELALACTFRVAVRGAKLGCPEIKLGVIPGYGATQRLPRLIGPARARQLILTGRMVDADRAEAIGLVDRVVEGDVVQAAVEFAAEFTCHSLPVLTLAREAIRRADRVPFADGLAAEAELGAIAYALEDSAEGIAAFKEKRAPRFRDR